MQLPRFGVSVVQKQAVHGFYDQEDQPVSEKNTKSELGRIFEVAKNKKQAYAYEICQSMQPGRVFDDAITSIMATSP